MLWKSTSRQVNNLIMAKYKHFYSTAAATKAVEELKPFKDIPGPLSLPFIGTAWQALVKKGKLTMRYIKHDDPYC